MAPREPPLQEVQGKRSDLAVDQRQRALAAQGQDTGARRIDQVVGLMQMEITPAVEQANDGGEVRRSASSKRTDASAMCKVSALNTTRGGRASRSAGSRGATKDLALAVGIRPTRSFPNSHTRSVRLIPALVVGAGGGRPMAGTHKKTGPEGPAYGMAATTQKLWIMPMEKALQSESF